MKTYLTMCDMCAALSDSRSLFSRSGSHINTLDLKIHSSLFSTKTISMSILNETKASRYISASRAALWLLIALSVYYVLSHSLEFGARGQGSEGTLDASVNLLHMRDDEKKSKSALDLIGVRIVIGIGVFAFINVVVITVHHIVQKVSRSTSTYKEIEHVHSPF